MPGANEGLKAMEIVSFRPVIPPRSNTHGHRMEYFHWKASTPSLARPRAWNGAVSCLISPPFLAILFETMANLPINPPTLSRPRGFSHAVEVEGSRLLFMAGQVAFDTNGQVVGKGNLVAQFRRVCENLKALVESRGGSLQDIAKMTIYVLDKEEYRRQSKAIGEVYREYFGRHYPAMTLVEVKGLYDQDAGCLIEIEAIAGLQ